jgi:hypothetical protein
MHAKIGAKVLICLLYGQALFGLVAVAAVAVKDPQSPREAAHAPAVIVAGLERAATW